jgi:hypothetical protein
MMSVEEVISGAFKGTLLAGAGNRFRSWIPNLCINKAEEKCTKAWKHAHTGIAQAMNTGTKPLFKSRNWLKPSTSE